MQERQSRVEGGTGAATIGSMKTRILVVEDETAFSETLARPRRPSSATHPTRSCSTMMLPDGDGRGPRRTSSDVSIIMLTVCGEGMDRFRPSCNQQEEHL